MIAWSTKTQEYHDEFGPGGYPVTVYVAEWTLLIQLIIASCSGGGGTFISLFAAGAPKSLIVLWNNFHTLYKGASLPFTS